MKSVKGRCNKMKKDLTTKLTATENRKEINKMNEETFLGLKKGDTVINRKGRKYQVVKVSYPQSASWRKVHVELENQDGTVRRLAKTKYIVSDKRSYGAWEKEEKE
jgi:hypothetical protein